MRDIWIFQNSFVGDCALTLPFLKELLRLEPEARLRLVVQKGIQTELFQLAMERGLASDRDRLEILPFDKKNSKGLLKTYQWMRRQMESSRGSEVSFAFCLHRSFRSAFMALLTGARARVGFSSGAATFLYTLSVPRSWDRGVHEIEKNLDMLRVVYGKEAVPEYLGRNLEKRPSLLASLNRPQRVAERAALALGSPWPTKRWPVEHAIQLCREWMQQGVEVLLLGDPSACAMAQEITQAVPSLLIQDHVGKTGMKDWVDLLDTCQVLVSGDSASVHVASDLGVPVLALFGPTVPEFGFSPWRSNSKVIQLSDLACRPCDIHGPKTCPLGHHKCLKELGAEHVLRHAKSHLLVDPQDKKL